MKPTKRQQRIVEHFVRQVLSEATKRSNTFDRIYTGSNKLKFTEDLFFDELENQSPKFRKKVLEWIKLNLQKWKKQVTYTWQKYQDDFDSGEILLKVMKDFYEAGDLEPNWWQSLRNKQKYK